MTTDNQSYLRFSIEESVWFQRGQEVDDLVSISLYPDITIEEHNQYITIRGALQLTGEYRIEKNSSNDSEDSNDFTSYGRLMNEVNTREDGISELKHRFPVDITIPKNRIQNLDDVYVSIDSFDYELPGSRCLQLVADLSISGISSNQKDQERAEEKEEFENNNNQFAQMETESSSLFKYEEDDDDVLNVFDHEEIQKPEENYYFQEVVEDEEDDDDVELESSYEEDDLYTPIEVEARREAYHENDNLEATTIENQGVSPQIEMKSRDDDRKWSYSYMADMNNSTKYDVRNEEKDNEYDEQNEPDYESRDENALYLTKIFAKNESQDFSRLKMYIVQTGDSLDKISERYDVSVQQLVRVNQLEQERTINDGQILYIPVQEKSRSLF